MSASGSAAPASATPATIASRVLVCDGIDDQACALLHSAGLAVEIFDGDRAALLRALPDVDALLVRSKTKVDAAVIAAAPRLRLVGRAGVGVDNIDVAAATRAGVVVVNAPEGNTVTTAELAITLICALARHVPAADRSVRAGRWEKTKFQGTELEGKVLGVVGLGRIGKVVADRAQGLKMRVIAYDPFLAPATGGAGGIDGVQIVDLDDLVARADFITIHTPLTDQTRALFDAPRLARMKRGARLVCAARGGIVDEQALVEALRSGHLAGAALDVFSEEPLPAAHPLREIENAILTPHLGASTEEAQQRVALQVAQQVVDFLREGVAAHAVNAPRLSHDALREVGPYLALARRLASIAVQLLGGEATERLEVELQGPEPCRHREALRLAVLVGALEPHRSTALNFVNAPVLASERGLRVLEHADPQVRDYVNSVQVRAHGREGASARVTGTVFLRTPRLVRFDDLPLDADPSGHLLITRHSDRPGVIGRIGTLLGEAQINISRLQLGQAGHDGAVGILNVDEAVPEAVLARIRALDFVQQVFLVKP
jgi:D-3-phosphoglycerate dehydrogenase